MKKIVMLIFLLMLVSVVFAGDYVIKYKTSEDSASLENLKSGVKGEFTVTFNGSNMKSSTDIGFSRSATSIGSGGLEKTSFADSKLEMTRDKSKTTVTYTASFYIYWYLFLNKAATLTLKVEPDSSVSSLTITGSKYTYSTGIATPTTKDISWTEGKDSSGNTYKTGEVASFGNYVAVYHGNSQIGVNAELSSYPKDNKIATLTLELTDNS